MKFTLITNNIDLYEKVKNKKDLDIIFDGKYSYGDILDIVKKKLQNGFELSTHPLCGSIKPNETPYRSILITKTKELDVNGIIIIDEAIETYKKFQNNLKTPLWIDRVLRDFRYVDCNILIQTIEKFIAVMDSWLKFKTANNFSGFFI